MMQVSSRTYRARLVSDSFSSGYDFAIPSSRLHLTMQTLGVAMKFVGNYAPCELSPQTGGMPVIPSKGRTSKTDLPRVTNDLFYISLSKLETQSPALENI